MEEKNTFHQFKFIKRRLSVHYSLTRELSPKERGDDDKTPIKSPTHKRTIHMQEQAIKKLKDIYLKNNSGYMFNNEERLSNYEESVLDYNSVSNFLAGDYDPMLQKVLQILITPYKERTETDSNNLLSFFHNIKLSETLKSDTLITDLSLNELYEYFKPFITGKIYNFMDTIYYGREKSNNLYIILHGNIGQYRLEKYEEELTCEDYYNFLSDCYNLYEEEMQMGYFYTEKDNPRKSYQINPISINDFIKGKTNVNHKNKIKEEDDKKEIKEEYKYSDESDESNDDDKKEQYIDHYLICQMIEENKEIYPLRDISDLVRLKKIIFKLRLYMVLTESSVKDAEILYILYDFPTSYLNFDKVLNQQITVQKYIEILSNNFKLYDYFYIKLLGSEKNKVKLMKYVKTTKNLTPYSKFGNYELNDLRSKRELTVRCESEKCILLSIDKKMYSLAVYNAQKKKREQDIEIMHNNYLFKNLSKKYFNNKVFSVFRIKNDFKGNVLIKQYETMNNFIFIKEGILELSLQNSSFQEFHQIIREVKEILIKKAKELKMNQKDLFDFDPEVDSKTTLHMNTIKGILHQKQTFLFHRNENGSFGDYEFYFEMPTILTGTIVSDKCLYYQYDIEKYRQLIQETYLLNESLKNNSFLKLKSLLKRMIMVYNSYWRLSLEQLEKKIKEKEDNLNNNEKVNEEVIKKTFNLTKKINNIPFLNANMTNRFSYQNMNSIGGDSPINKKYKFKGIETTGSYFNNFKRNNIRQNSINNSKFKLNDMANSNYKNSNKNSFRLNNKSLNPKQKKETKNNWNKTYDEKIQGNKMDLAIENNKITDFDKNVNININNKIIKRDKYQKKLIEKFKQEMDSQRVAKKRMHKKIFLPPLTGFSPINIKSSLNFLNDKNRNKKSSKLNLLENDDNQKSKGNSTHENMNISLVINNSFSSNNSKIVENVETIHTNNETKTKNITKKKALSKEPNKRTINLKMVQLYNIISRKVKAKNK